MPEDVFAQAVFNDDANRERKIIEQSNNRSAAISQMLSAVWGASGIVAVFILAKPEVRVTAISAVFGIIAVAFFAVQLLAKAAILWPRGLHNLPNDKDGVAYRARLAKKAEQMRRNPMAVADEKYDEGYLLQRIRAKKEIFTRVTLAAIACYLPFAVLFLVTLDY
jgi:hypothetical protein